MKLKERLTKKRRNLKFILVTTVVVGGVAYIIHNRNVLGTALEFYSAAKDVIEDLGGEPVKLIVEKVSANRM